MQFQENIEKNPKLKMSSNNDRTLKWSNLLMETIEWEAEQKEKRLRAHQNHTKEVVIGKLSKQVRQLARKVREQDQQLKEKSIVTTPSQTSSIQLPLKPNLKIGPLPIYLPITQKSACKINLTASGSNACFPVVSDNQSSMSAFDTNTYQQSTNSTTVSLSDFMYPNDKIMYQRPLPNISALNYSMTSNSPPRTSTKPTH